MKSNDLGLQQTKFKFSPGKVEVYVQQHNFHAGTIDLINKTFTSVPRTSKNVFHLFGGGLGLNSEVLFTILPYYQVETIILPFEGRVLQTTASKWRKLGIVSPYGDQRIDKQLVLSIDLINLNDVVKYSVAKVQAAKPNYQLSLIF